ncbi:hypothetical protein [uncultured Mediterranean phage uvMED]|nr:hypothetical protein [uncultured Mediterranean phage uvMED]BAR18617.1 hypothetical protein [uncultured Mediterranean phage uvMED]BAR18690.1 hypothetical protein [uncultured Mediterranean phage uvMED]BAR18733.1 hypothetical protein [uncultured Mediterranean phage uvMED]BAR18820.1 hypothetical protein [uncultured Mediterranean phage uvMED]
MKHTSKIKLTDIDWNFNNPHKGILMFHFKYLELIWLDDLLNYVLDNKLDDTFERPSFYSGKPGLIQEFRFGKKQKEEIKKCLRHFYPDKKYLEVLQAGQKWYEKKDLIKYD